jgi:transposase
VAERVRVWEITSQEGNRLLRIVRRSSGSVVTWRRAQMVLLSAQGMDVGQIAQVTFASRDRVRDVVHNFNLDGFDALYPRYRGGRPPTFTLAQRRAITQLALSRPVDHELPFSTWSLAKLAEFLVAEGVVDDHLPRGPAAPAPPGGRVLSNDQDLEAVQRSGLRGQEEPHPAPVRADGRHRRWPAWRPGGGRVRR